MKVFLLGIICILLTGCTTIVTELGKDEVVAVSSKKREGYRGEWLTLELKSGSTVSFSTIYYKGPFIIGNTYSFKNIKEGYNDAVVSIELVDEVQDISGIQFKNN